MTNNTFQNSLQQTAAIDFTKYADGLVPAIIQDDITSKVLMLGFMNAAALTKTKELQKVTFFSRSKNRLWTKGEESGNYLLLKDIKADCDNDTLLIKATPQGMKKMRAIIFCCNWKKLSWIEKITSPTNPTPVLCLKKE
jgi:phosphoribosyl-AMP cyclohydrolase